MAYVPFGSLAPTPAQSMQAPAVEQNFLQQVAGSPGFGNALQALGVSLMSSPSNNPLEGFAPALQNAQAQTERERQIAVQEEERAAAEAEKAQWAQYAQSVVPEQLKGLAQTDPKGALTIWQQMQPERVNPTANMQNVDFLVANGMDRQDAIAQIFGGTSSAPTLTSIYDANGREQKGYMNGTEFVPIGSPKANTERPEFNVSQALAAGFADRMIQSDTLLSDPELTAASMDRAQVYQSGTPIIGNNLVSPEYRQADQAKRDFINAILRRESGAVIGADEFANANVQYFPQPGDDQDTLNQKAANRATAINGVKRSAGPAYEMPDTTNYLTGDTIAQPNSEAEYNALPSGAIFIDPDDGKQYTKP